MSKLKCCLQIPSQQKCASMALLFVRIVMGIAFLYHGYGKIQAPFSWMPPEAPIPGIFQFLAALSEFGGGLALILGLLTRIAMSGLAVTMLVATAMHAIQRGDPFVNQTGGPAYELPLLYLSLSVMFILLGPGKFSVDSKLFGEKDCTPKA